MGSPSNFIFLPEAMAVVTGDRISQSSLWGGGGNGEKGEIFLRLRSTKLR